MFVEMKKSVFNVVQAIYDINSTSQIAHCEREEQYYNIVQIWFCNIGVA